MKKTIIALCFMLSIKASQSQTIDTCVKYCVASKVVPVIYTHGFPVVNDTITDIGVFEFKSNDSIVSISFTLIAKNPTRNVLFGWEDFKKSEILRIYTGELVSLLEPLRKRFGLTFR